MRNAITLVLILLANTAIAAPHWGNYPDGGTLYFYTNTVGTDGVAETPASEAIAVYKDGSATQLTTGATIDDDFDSVVGYHQIAIDTTQSGFDAGSLYTVVYSAGTVDSVSITGRVIGSFYLGTVDADVREWSGTAVASPATAGYPAVTIKDGTGTGEIDTASGLVKVDGASSTGLLTAQNIEDEILDAALSGHTTAGTVAKALSDILEDTGTSGVQIPAGEIVAATFGAGAIDASAIAADAIGASELATDAIGAAEIAANAIGASEVADDSIDAGAIATSAIGSAEIATGAIGASEIAAGAIVYDDEFVGTVNAAVTSLGANVVTAASTASDFIAEINAEIVDALATDTYAEPGQGTPAATTTLAAKINYMYKAWRNKKDTDGSVTNYYNDAGDTVDHKASVGEAAGTTTVGEVATGP